MRDLAGSGRPDVLAHGTTVATNALLERRGARVALVATRGFADVIEIARQDRPSLYDPFVDRPAPLVPRALRFEVDERLDAAGASSTPFDGAVPGAARRRRRGRGLPAARRSRTPRHERAVAGRAARARVRRRLCSHEVSPEFREYERMVTTVVEAYLRAGVRAVPRRASTRSRPRCS